MYFFLVWDRTIHLVSFLSSGHGLQEKVADSVLRSKLQLVSPNRWGRSQGPFSDPWGCRVAHLWKQAERKLRRFLPATQAVLCLTQMQPWLLPPTPHQGPWPPCPNQSIEVTRGRVPCFWGQTNDNDFPGQGLRTCLVLGIPLSEQPLFPPLMFKCHLYHTLIAEIDLGLFLELLSCSLIWVSHLAPATQF